MPGRLKAVRHFFMEKCLGFAEKPFCFTEKSSGFTDKRTRFTDKSSCRKIPAIKSTILSPADSKLGLY